MEKQCKICGGKLIETRLRTGAYLLGVAPTEDDKKIKPRYSIVLCDTCVALKYCNYIIKEAKLCRIFLLPMMKRR